MELLLPLLLILPKFKANEYWSTEVAISPFLLSSSWRVLPRSTLIQLIKWFFYVTEVALNRNLFWETPFFLLIFLRLVVKMELWLVLRNCILWTSFFVNLSYLNFTGNVPHGSSTGPGSLRGGGIFYSISVFYTLRIYYFNTLHVKCQI